MRDVSDRIQHLRDDFTKFELTEETAGLQPFTLFETWMHQALDAEVNEPQAMGLSTVSASGRVSSRMVYLRLAQNHCFGFYGNYQSLKGQHIKAHNRAALLFFWPELQRQIRIEGLITQMAPSDSAAYFKERPRSSQLGAWASPQSAVLKNRSELDHLLEEVNERFKNQAVPCPEFWGGWILTADYYEFWQGRPSRLHDRIIFERSAEQWLRQRIAP
jgi:pyridoxamine 5'-phosphate oxidase